MGVAAKWLAWERSGRHELVPASRGSVTYPTTKLRGLVEIAPGADLTADPATWSWVDISQWVRFKSGISTTVGRRDQAGTVDPGRATLTIDNRDGRFSRRNPTGPYYGQLTRNTPIRMGVDPGSGMAYRYYGFVNEWPKRWDRSGNDSTVLITCGGILRRLQRSAPLRSALYRTMAGIAEDDYQPYVYWPMEDGGNATRIASGLVGGGPASANGGVNFAADSDIAGSAPLPTLDLSATISAPVAGYTATGQWVAQFTMMIPSEPSGDWDLGEFRTPGGTVTLWKLRFEQGAPDALYVRGYDTSGVEQIAFGTGAVSGDLSVAADFYGHWFMISVAAYQNSGNVQGWLKGKRADGLNIESATSVVAGTHAGISGNIVLRSPVGGTGYGHLAVFTDPNFSVIFGDSQADINAAGMDGHSGEMAHERMVRICREEGMSITCQAAVSAAVGAQPQGTLLDVLRDAERADMGVLYEHEWGLAYRSFDEYCNPTAQLALDFDAGHVADPPQTDDSDLRFRNQWTVSRTSGSSATVRDPDYDPNVGLYEGSTTANVETDEQLSPIGGWLVHRDTADEDYWTGVKLRFARTPDLIPGWTTLPYGSRLTIANPPDQADPGQVDAILEGWSERWDTVTWEATLNTSPASIWRVGRVAEESGDTDPFVGRVEPETLTLAADVSSSATSWQINSDPLWTTVADDFPTDLVFGGEKVTFTAVSGASAPQTATVTRSVNGIVKAQTAGTSGQVFYPFRPIP